MEFYFRKIFLTDIRSWKIVDIIVISLTASKEYLTQYGFKDDEINNIKNIALEKIHRQKQLKDYVAANLIE